MLLPMSYMNLAVSDPVPFFLALDKLPISQSRKEVLAEGIPRLVPLTPKK